MDGQLLREQRVHKEKSRKEIVHALQKKTKENNRGVADECTKRKSQRKLVKTKSSKAKDRIMQAAHKPKESEK